jgi:uncharacterized protein YdaU (DUF1376 family)
LSDRAPYFQWYPKDCDTDENVRAMDDREFGFYVRLLNHAWLNNGIPADPKRMAAIMGRTPSYIAKIWPAIAPCFEARDGRLFNRKQEKSREILQNNSKIKSAAASVRWDKAKKTQDGIDARASAVQCYPESDPDPDPDCQSSSKVEELKSNGFHPQKLTTTDDRKFATPKDELIALMLETTGHMPEVKVVRTICERLEINGGQLSDYLIDIRPRIGRLRKPPAEGFFMSEAKKWGTVELASEPETIQQQAARNGHCDRCKRVGIVNGEFCDCKMGRDLRAIEDRKLKQQQQQTEAVH